MKKYIQYEQFYFPENTPEEVMKIVCKYHRKNERLIVSYGDIDTGKDWEEQYGIEGYIGRTTGIKPIPILVYNSRSIGGPSILTSHVVRIRLACGKSVLYEHPFYHKSNSELIDKMRTAI
jgi:hypothetical protein